MGSSAHYGSCWSQLMVGHHLNLGAKAFCLSLLLFIKIEKGNPNALIKAREASEIADFHNAFTIQILLVF